MLLGVDSPFFSTSVLFNTPLFPLFFLKKDAWKEWGRHPLECWGDGDEGRSFSPPFDFGDRTP